MTSYLFGAIYIVLGLVGATAHYLKKRYIDNTTTDSFGQYLSANKQATFNALWTLVCSEVGLSLAHTEGFLTLSETVAALSSGYAVDSILNKSSEIR